MVMTKRSPPPSEEATKAATGAVAGEAVCPKSVCGTTTCIWGTLSSHNLGWRTPNSLILWREPLELKSEQIGGKLPRLVLKHINKLYMSQS